MIAGPLLTLGHPPEAGNSWPWGGPFEFKPSNPEPPAATSPLSCHTLDRWLHALIPGPGTTHPGTVLCSAPMDATQPGHSGLSHRHSAKALPGPPPPAPPPAPRVALRGMSPPPLGPVRVTNFFLMAVTLLFLCYTIFDLNKTRVSLKYVAREAAWEEPLKSPSANPLPARTPSPGSARGQALSRNPVGEGHAGQN